VGELLDQVRLVYQQPQGFAVEPGVPCVFQKPSAIGSVVPPEGGMVEIPVSAVGPCLPWSVDAPVISGATSSRAVNPGPHVGSAVLRVIVSPTLVAATATVSLPVPGRITTVTQEGALPSAPHVAATLADGRVTVSWTPSFGAAANRFLVYGGLRGGSLILLASLPADSRSWTSMPLPPGSYEVRVAAGHLNESGPMSEPFEFSVGIAAIPDAPINLQSTTADDVVKLQWSPAPSGSAPSAYDVEAAPSGSASFTTVRRVVMPELAVTDVPTGTWDVRVRAVTDGGRGAASNVVTVTTARCTTAPSAPTSLISVGSSYVAPMAHVEWSPPAIGGANDYVIDVGLASGRTDARIVSPGPGLVFETAAPRGIYFARVRARNACGESAPSNEVIVFVP
jgi:hypothetical protein